MVAIAHRICPCPPGLSPQGMYHKKHHRSQSSDQRIFHDIIQIKSLITIDKYLCQHRVKHCHPCHKTIEHTIDHKAHKCIAGDHHNSTSQIVIKKHLKDPFQHINPCIWKNDPNAIGHTDQHQANLNDQRRNDQHYHPRQIVAFHRKRMHRICLPLSGQIQEHTGCNHNANYHDIRRQTTVLYISDQIIYLILRLRGMCLKIVNI